jgi:polysaccharide export outer membrane protein
MTPEIRGGRRQQLSISNTGGAVVFSVPPFVFKGCRLRRIDDVIHGMALSLRGVWGSSSELAGREQMSKHSRRAMMALGSALVIGGLLTGCAVNDPHGPSGFVTSAPQPDLREYAIQPGDSIDVTFYYHPENSQQNLLVRPDGKVLLSLIGEVQAAGLTAPQLADAVTKSAAANLRDPKVVVNIRTLNQRGIFVGGEVLKPGFVNYVPGITALQAIVQSGGWKDTADLEKVVLLQRITENSNEYRPSRLDLARVIELGETQHDIVLGPSDVIVLPRTGIALANLWMEQYVIKMLPIRISASPF